MASEVLIVLACFVASVSLLLSSIVAPPDRVTCPHGWWLPEGARDGLVVCRRLPTGDAVRNSKGFLVDTGIDPPGELRVQLGCRGVDVRQDGTSAWCAK